MIKIVKVEVKTYNERKISGEGLDMIVHMSEKNRNLYIPIPFTDCLCLVVGNDSINKFATLSKTSSASHLYLNPHSSKVKKNFGKMCLI
jgi:hypothetical protein